MRPTPVCLRSTKKSKPMAEPSYAIPWQEDAAPNLGEGISRTSSVNARLHKVEVLIGNRLMKTTIRAASKAEAMKFTKNRYPSATSIVYTGRTK